MTDIGPSIPRDRQLDAADIRYLFDRLSSHLREAGSTGHHLMIAGGAALALMWEDRTTHDVDVLEHRSRAPQHQGAERRTAAVDFISMRFPAELATAARLVAEAEGLPRNWLNGAVAIFTPGWGSDTKASQATTASRSPRSSGSPQPRWTNSGSTAEPLRCGSLRSCEQEAARCA